MYVSFRFFITSIINTNKFIIIIINKNIGFKNIGFISFNHEKEPPKIPIFIIRYFASCCCLIRNKPRKVSIRIFTRYSGKGNNSQGQNK